MCQWGFDDEHNSLLFQQNLHGMQWVRESSSALRTWTQPSWAL
jgi:hypothetical protein